MTPGTPGVARALPGWFPPALVLTLALAAGGATLGNGFAYDDVHLILQNDRIHDLARLPAVMAESYWPPVPLGQGGRLYRPVTMAGFTLQWAIGGGRPLVFHVVNLLWLGIVALLVLALALRLLPRGPATLAASLFAVHPVHTEVVGNVVGQAELLTAAWFLLGALFVADGARRGWTSRRLVGACASLGLAFLSKEQGLMLLVLAPFVVAAVGGRRALLGEPSARLLLLLTLVAMLCLSLRTAVLGTLGGDLPHPLWRGLPPSERILTMLTVIPTWGRLLFWPASLQADYSPREVQLTAGLTPPVALGLLLLAGLFLLGWLGRRTSAIWLGVAWLALTALPTANLLFPTGVVLAERLLFLPSVGACLVVGGLIASLGPALDRRPGTSIVLGVAIYLVLGLGLVASTRRLPVWRDNQVLFARTVVDAPLSYWAWRNQAGSLVLQGREREALDLYRRSLSLFDRDPTVYDDFAGVERRLGHCDRAVPLLRRALQIDPERHQTAARLVGCLTTLGAWDTAREVARERLTRGRAEFGELLHLVDSAQRSAQVGVSPLPSGP